VEAPAVVLVKYKQLCQRKWIAVELDACIAQWGVQYIGGRDPPRAGGQEGGGQERRL
jgi:hypothetical protein